MVDAEQGTARLTMWCCDEPIAFVILANNEAVNAAITRHFRSAHGHTGPDIEVPAHF